MGDTANMSQEQTKQARKQQRKARAALHSRSRAANAEHFQRTKYKQAAEQSEAQVERLENQMSRASRAHGRTAKLARQLVILERNSASEEKLRCKSAEVSKASWREARITDAGKGSKSRAQKRQRQLRTF